MGVTHALRGLPRMATQGLREAGSAAQWINGDPKNKCDSHRTTFNARSRT
jgi:hypothetical protein